MPNLVDTRRQRFEALFRIHQPGLQRMARRLCGRSGIDPEDLVQETLERALASFDRLAREREAGWSSWLATTLTNRFFDLCRRRRTETQGLPELKHAEEPVADIDGTAAREAWEQVPDQAIRDALSKLNPNMRQAYELRAEGLRYRAISQQLGVPEGTVATLLFQARQRLRTLLVPGSAERGG